MLISGWTWIWNPFTRPYSHIEIGFLVEGEWRYFSSSARSTLIGTTFKNGTRWIEGKKLLKNPKRWDVYENDYSIKEVEGMVTRATDILGCPYDHLGIIGFVTLTGKLLNLKNAWYCSEACWYVLTGQWLKRISPRRMSKKIQLFGFKLCSNF